MHGRKPKKRNKLFPKGRNGKSSSMFLHLTIVFMLIGLLPLVLLGSLFVKSYSDNMKTVIIESALSKVYSISKNINSVLEGLDEDTQYLYKYSSEEYENFYELLKDKKLNDGQLASKIDVALNTLLYLDKDIEGVRFIDKENRLYCMYKDATKNIYGKVMLSDSLKSVNPKDFKKLYFYPAFAEKKYYYPSEDYIFTAARYYMDTSTVTSANNTVLGTIYLDINISKLATQIKDVQSYENGSIYIIDKESGAYIYSETDTDYGTGYKNLDIIKSEDGSGYKQLQNYSIVFRNIEDSSWVVVTQIYNQDIYQAYRANVTYFSIILIAACVF